MLLDMDEAAEWFNSFVLVPKSNGKVSLCLGPVRLNHRGPMHHDILLKLNNAQYISLIDMSFGYYNLKVDKKSSYFTTFTCHFGRYRYKRLPFGAAPAGDMFQRTIDEIFKGLPNVFAIADDILVVGYDVDGEDHDDIL